MEEERIDLTQEMSEEEPAYIPRPAWQVWAARLALVLFVGIVIMYYINIARGGI